MPGEIKKTKARDELIRFAEEETQQKFHKLSGVQQSHELTRFYVKEIHNRIKTEISDDDLELAIVDGGSDLGCDLIHRDDNQVLIIQSKYRSSGNSEKPEEISHFRSVLNRLLDRNLRANPVREGHQAARRQGICENTLTHTCSKPCENQRADSLLSIQRRRVESDERGDLGLKNETL
jgi:hypothetical protein